MRIHTVKEGDTVFKIARSYSTPPAKIIENNALIAPDRLYPGQKLVILTPTRTYTVRGGDTLKSIALRFGVDTQELKRNNPSLMGGDRIYPGQILAVKYGEKEYGNAVVNGYYSRDCTKDRLSLYLPYLTYVTIASHKWENGELCRLFNYDDALKLSKIEGALPVMRVYTGSALCELQKEMENFSKQIISRAKSDGFQGVSFSGGCVKEDGFGEFLREFRNELKKSELELHLELDGNASVEPYKDLSETADVVLLNFDRDERSLDMDFASCEEALLNSYSSICESRKTLLDVFSPSYLGDEAVDFQEIEKLIISRGIEAAYCEKSKTGSFRMKRYSGGQNKEISAHFPTPENTKAKLELLGELGFMGVSFDIKRSPISSLMAFNSLFHAEKASSVAENSCRDRT